MSMLSDVGALISLSFQVKSCLCSPLLSILLKTLSSFRAQSSILECVKMSDSLFLLFINFSVSFEF